MRRVDAGEDVNITRHAADDVQPAFSPDGTSIAFVSTRASRTGLVKTGTFIGFDTRTYGGDVWVVPALGGQARRVASDGNFPVWHPHGRVVAYVAGLENQRTILEVPVEGGQAITVLPASLAVWEILRLAYAPNGRWISFETADREVFAMPARGGTPTRLFRGSSHTWDPSGRRIYFVNQLASGGTRIEAAALNETVDSLAAAETVIAGVSVGTLKELAFASDGQHLLAASVEESLNLTRVPLSPDGASVAGREEALSHGQVRDRYAAVSPDSARIAVGSNRIGQQELWVLDLPSRRWDRIALPPAATGLISQACWARDGRHLVVMRYLEDWYEHLLACGARRQHGRATSPTRSGDQRRLRLRVLTRWQAHRLRASCRGVQSALSLRPGDAYRAPADDVGVAQVRSRMVARRPVAGVLGQRWGRHPGLAYRDLRRRRAAVDEWLRAESTPVLFTRRAVAVRPTEPSQHLADAGRRRTAAAGNALRRVRAVAGGTDPLAGRPLARLRQEWWRRLAVDADAGRRREAVTLVAGVRLVRNPQCPPRTGGMGEEQGSLRQTSRGSHKRHPTKR